MEITVLLDNGHGRQTPGKCSPILPDGRQLFEWKYTRQLTKAIQEKLTEAGIPSKMIVPEDRDVALSTRAKRANQMIMNLGKCILISVHCNAFDGTVSGWEVWSTEATNNSDKLAQCFLDEFDDVFPDKKIRGHKEKNWTVLFSANCPCVLTENFFMDNIEECEWMLSEEGFDSIVDLHVRSIKRYIDLYNK
jgi:N-acetylmuramoyl-L-alanine amidase